MLVRWYNFMPLQWLFRYNVILSYPAKSNPQSIEHDSHISVKTRLSDGCSRISKNISKEGNLYSREIFNTSKENDPTLYWHICSPDIVALLKLQSIEGILYFHLMVIWRENHPYKWNGYRNKMATGISSDQSETPNHSQRHLIHLCVWATAKVAVIVIIFPRHNIYFYTYIYISEIWPI